MASASLPDVRPLGCRARVGPAQSRGIGGRSRAGPSRATRTSAGCLRCGRRARARPNPRRRDARATPACARAPPGRSKVCRSRSRTGSTSRGGRSPGHRRSIATVDPSVTRPRSRVCARPARSSPGSRPRSPTALRTAAPSTPETRRVRPVVRPPARRPSSPRGRRSLALGSDSGGSIRLPAAWCGVCGLKPSFGRVPLTGHFPRLGSLSDARTVIGPLANSVDDLALALQLIAGPDGLDGGVMPVPLGDPAACRRRAPADRHHARRRHRGSRDVGRRAARRRRDRRRRSARSMCATKRSRSPAATGTAPQLDGRANEQLLWDWDRFQRRMLQCMAPIDALLVPATTEPAPPWRESIDTDYVWQLPWSLTGSPAVVLPVGSEATSPSRSRSSRRAGTTTSCSRSRSASRRASRLPTDGSVVPAHRCVTLPAVGGVSARGGGRSSG